MIADSLISTNRSDVQSRIGAVKEVSVVKRSATIVSIPKQECGIKRSSSTLLAPRQVSEVKRIATVVSVPKHVKTAGILGK